MFVLAGLFACYVVAELLYLKDHVAALEAWQDEVRGRQ